MRSRSVTVVSVLLLSACRAPTPAENPARSPTPAPAVWLESPREQPPAPPPIDAPGMPVHATAVATLYGCWFEHPYEYMFANHGAQIRVGDREWGRFMAGVSGILDYGSFATCARKLGGEQQRGGFGDHSSIASLAGLSIHAENGDGDQNPPFGFYNPEIVRWGHSYLIPDPRERIAGASAADIYPIVFSRYFRLMAESYVVLQHEGRYEAEQKAYWEMAERTRKPRAKAYMGIEWLEKRYAGELPGNAYGGSFDGTQWTVPMAYGFWLRRGIDGTDEELWLGLQKLLVRYDREFLRELERQYPRADFTSLN